jgi:small conductance mechanosensitive channel
MDAFANELARRIAIYGPKIAVALFIFVAFWVVGSLVQGLILRFAKSTDRTRLNVINLLSQLAKTTLLVLGTLTAIGTAGVNVSALVAGLGLTGFALGFAFRDVLSNFLAGLLILFYQPFRIGDRILVVGLEGIVTGIDLRYTVLQGEDRRYLVPNSVLFTNPISLISIKERPMVAP